MYEGDLDPHNKAYAAKKIEQWQAKQRELIKDSNNERLYLYRQSWREQIGGETRPHPVLTKDSKGDTINVRDKIFNLSYEQAEHLKNRMTNEVARNFYVTHVKNIASSVDKSLPIEKQAKQAFEMRNKARSFTRELMADKEAAKILESRYKNYTWEGIIEHKHHKGLTDGDVFVDIIKTAIESNKSVNKEFGV